MNLKYLLKMEPVAVAFAVVAIPIVGAFVVAVASAGNATETAVAILTGAGPLLAALGAAWARAKVTPDAKKKPVRHVH